MERSYYVENMALASEERMTLPVHLEQPHDSYQQYLKLSPIEQVHTLDDDTLVFLHHSMREGYPTRASHLLAGAWTQIELAHVRDFQGASVEAQELIAMAKSQLNSCENLIERHYKNHPDYFDRLYRTRMAFVYADHFAQLGPVSWPEHLTNFQLSAYERVQEELVNPLLDDFYNYERPRGEDNKYTFGALKGLLGELVVLQTLNRLQSQQEHNEWSVAPASMRENSFTNKSVGALSTAFDLKLTFADQTFIPIEVKWGFERQRSSYDPSTAFICANLRGLDVAGTAAAMAREIGGESLPLDIHKIEAMTRNTLKCIEQVDRKGVSVWPDQYSLV